MSWVFDGLTEFGYGVILADPPWAFKTRSAKGGGRSASRHYGTMTLADIKAMPVSYLAADNCVLFLWSLNSMPQQALDVIDAWGFTHKTTAFTWAKPGMGMGYWTRQDTESCLLATRGNPKRLHADVRELISAPRREHSRKPDETHERIERLVAGPYVELFARQARPGWEAWGNQVGLFPAMPAMKEAA